MHRPGGRTAARALGIAFFLRGLGHHKGSGIEVLGYLVWFL